jgi:hypothetical protein
MKDENSALNYIKSFMLHGKEREICEIRQHASFPLTC